jgi:hypothetical protein
MHRRTRVPAIRAVLLSSAILLVAGAGCTGSSPDANQPSGNGNAITNGTDASGTPAFPLPKDPAAAIKQANLPELPDEVLAYHVHAHVDLEINGHAVTIPAGIGITTDPNTREPDGQPKRTGISPLHTHDTSGIAHIEAAKEDVFTVGQLFAEWGVKLDKSCVATYCTDDNNQLLGFLNGELVGDPASIPLTSHANVYLWFGKKGTNPKAPTFTFPEGA